MAAWAALLSDRRHLDGAIIIDVDLCAGGFGDLADHFAARPDYLPDLVLWNLRGGDPRGIFADRIARAGQCLGHLAQDMDPALSRLVQRDAHDFLGDRGDLDVHLQCRDTLFGAGHLKVHVAEMVLVAKDV